MRIVKIEVPVYRYAELNDKAKEVVKDHILSATRDAQDFTDSVKHTLDVLGVEESEVYYSLGNCQGDGLCFTGSITWNKAIEILYIKESISWMHRRRCLSFQNHIRYYGCFWKLWGCIHPL